MATGGADPSSGLAQLEPVRRQRRFIAGLLVVASVGLAIRLVYVLVFRAPLTPFQGDALFYSGGASNLVLGHGFTEPLAPFVTLQSASHPPFYLVYLSIISAVWNAHTPSQTVFMVWSCVLGTGSIVLIGCAAREVVSSRVGLIAAALAAIYPNIWVHDGMLLSETSAIFMSALVMLLAYRYVRRPGFLRVLWVGAAAGLGALARPELVLLLPLLLVPLALGTRGFDWRRRLAALAVGVIAALMVMSPWVLFNLSRFDSPVFLSTNLGGTLAAANTDATYYGKIIGYKDYNGAREVIAKAEARSGTWKRLDPSEQDRAIRAESMHYIRAHLTRLPVVILARLGRITHLYEPFQEVAFDRLFLRQETAVGYAIVWSFWGVALLALGGVVLLRRQRVQVWPLLIIPAIVCISVAMTFAQTRYRAPAEVSLVILAAVSIDTLVTTFSRLRGRPRRGERVRSRMRSRRVERVDVRPASSSPD